MNSNLNNIHILLVEDSLSDQFLMQEILEKTTFPISNLTITESLASATNILSKNKIDLVFLDLSLPDSHGLETCKAITENHYGIPIIVLTGLNDVHVGLEAISLGAADYIVKGTLDEYGMERAILYALQRNETQRQITKTMDMLRGYNQKLEQFAHIISHDLMSPIVSIKASIQLYELEKKHNDLTQTAEEVMKEVGEGVDKLHNKLKSLVKTLVEQQTSGSKFDTILLSSFTEKVIRDMKDIYNQPDIDIEVDLDEEQKISFVPDLMYSIMQNLLSNAIKYRSPKRSPKIKIWAEPQEEYYCLNIEDNGIGIDMEANKNKLFGMFQRLHEENTDIDGRGIGLHLVRNIVYSNGGKIDVTSQVDVGTKFSIFLPREPRFI
ncbi:sensor histidine kinase [Bernardetia sp.]|uniref:sensor histidine kinase n=1 Tax=Bernardetia sp. TaxID=1937974 RepID=UPI0025BB14EB|nr:hybrid sensor histidine kinase/response regulator [Bernardetia sp.]